MSTSPSRTDVKSLDAYNRATIARGSASFATAARLFPRALRADVHALYAWCRHCDDVIDGQHLGFAARAEAQTPERSLEHLQIQTRAVFSGQPVDEPAFQSLSRVIARHPIPEALAFHHLEGFAIDVHARPFESLDDTLGYSYHVAGAVGVMMAIIMGVRDGDSLDRASDLGIAFQLTNIARDVLEDAATGRCYLPRLWLDRAGIPARALDWPVHRRKLHELTGRLVETAEPYYRSAATGIAALPPRAAWAIATALGVYRAIGRQVVKNGPEGMQRRTWTSRSRKLLLTAGGLARALSSRVSSGHTARTGLWNRPPIPLAGHPAPAPDH